MKTVCFGGLRAPGFFAASQKTFFSTLQRVFFFSAVAAAADYETLGMGVTVFPKGSRAAVDPTLLQLVRHALAQPEGINQLWPPGPHPGGSVVQLTLNTALHALATTPADWVVHFLAGQLGEHQWAVAANVLFLHTLHPGIRSHFLGSGLDHVRLSEWPTVCKPWWNSIRRCPYSPLVPGATHSDWQLFRKHANICGRSKDPADWAAEFHRRTENTPVHYSINAYGQLDRGRWIQAQHTIMRRFATAIVGNVGTIPDLQTAAQWWSNRWKTVAAGSTSNRHAAQFGGLEDEFDKGARPNKKVIAESRPDSWLAAVLTSFPCKFARQSTKHEPGFKNRALFATDDDAFAVAAYQSAEMEKRMNLGGMRVMQTPADIVDWIRSNQLSTVGGRWLSLDYSDFNSDHELLSLAELDRAFAEAWLSVGCPTQRYAAVCLDKAVAALTCSEMHYCSFSEGPTGASTERTGWRVAGGLFSGDRNTARDNTILHAVYSHIMQQDLEQFGFQRPIATNFTGDDEDSCFVEWEGGLVYMLLHGLAQFELKPAKQMAGDEHEFLQRMITPEGDVTRPLCAALAQFASGNWYHDVYSWYDSMPGAVSANGWELHTRGLALPIVQRLVGLTLNMQMRVRVPENITERAPYALADQDRQRALQEAAGGRLALEWWPWRGTGGIGSKALWGLPTDWEAPSVAMPPPPRLKRALELPHAAADAMTRQQQDRFRDKAAANWDRYRTALVESTYSAMRKQIQADGLAEWALWNWPLRATAPPDSLPATAHDESCQQWNWLVQTCGGLLDVDRAPRSMNEVLGRMRLDPDLVTTLGGLQAVLPLLEPEVLARYVAPATQAQLPTTMAALDPAVQSWLSSLFARFGTQRAPRPLLCRYAVSLEGQAHYSQASRRLWLVLAPNAAGKSTWTAQRPIAAELDGVLARVGHTAVLKQESYRYRSLGWVAQITQQTLDVLVGEGRLVLVSQLYPPEFLEACTARGIQCGVATVSPDKTELLHRMRDRGWTFEKCVRRLARWDATLRAVAAAEVANHCTAHHLHSWDQLDQLLIET